MDNPLAELIARIKVKIATVEHDEFLSPLEALEWCLFEARRANDEPPTTGDLATVDLPEAYFTEWDAS